MEKLTEQEKFSKIMGHVSKQFAKEGKEQSPSSLRPVMEAIKKKYENELLKESYTKEEFDKFKQECFIFANSYVNGNMQSLEQSSTDSSEKTDVAPNSSKKKENIAIDAEWWKQPDELKHDNISYMRGQPLFNHEVGFGKGVVTDVFRYEVDGEGYGTAIAIEYENGLREIQYRNRNGHLHRNPGEKWDNSIMTKLNGTDGFKKALKDVSKEGPARIVWRNIGTQEKPDFQLLHLENVVKGHLWANHGGPSRIHTSPFIAEYIINQPKKVDGKYVLDDSGNPIFEELFYNPDVSKPSYTRHGYLVNNSGQRVERLDEERYYRNGKLNSPINKVTGKDLPATIAIINNPFVPIVKRQWLREGKPLPQKNGVFRNYSLAGDDGEISFMSDYLDSDNKERTSVEKTIATTVGGKPVSMELNSKGMISKITFCKELRGNLVPHNDNNNPAEIIYNYEKNTCSLIFKKDGKPHNLAGGYVQVYQIDELGNIASKAEHVAFGVNGKEVPLKTWQKEVVKIERAKNLASKVAGVREGLRI